MAESSYSWVVFDGGVLKPYAPFDLALLTDKYKPGARLRAKFALARSPKHHRLYWGVLRMVVEITGSLWANAEALNTAVKTQLRMFGDGVLLLNGEVRYELQSISHDAMDQGAFKIFFEQAMQAIGEATCIDMDHVIRLAKMEIAWTAKDESSWASQTRSVQ